MCKERFVTILEWMLSLNLRGNDLIAYALIYGFSQDGVGTFRNSEDYLSKWLGISKRRTHDVLRRLLDSGLIDKTERYEGPIKYCEYFVVFHPDDETSVPMTKRPSPVDETSMASDDETSMESVDETSPNNKRVNKRLNKKDNKDLSFPYHSDEFMDTWRVLIAQPKWKSKSHDALQMSLNKLGKWGEGQAIEAMQNTISSGWQGLFEPDGPKHKDQGDRKRESIEANRRKMAEMMRPNYPLELEEYDEQ